MGQVWAIAINFEYSPYLVARKGRDKNIFGIHQR